MLNYLRQEIAKKEKEKQKAFYAQENTADEVDEAILECAHLFNEMEELTIVGTNVQRERPVIDIPIEDDVELDLIEMDVKTGRIVDVPMDVQTSEAFLVEKTYDDFYHEGMHKIPRFNRESQKSYEERIAEYASAKYEAYHDYIVQEGLFGNDMMSVSDERVPSNAMVDLGQLHEGSQKHFVTKLPVYFETTLDSKISLNQIHALNLAGNLEAFEHMGEALRGLLMRDGYRDILYRNEIWDIATPIRVIVPIVMDKYTVGVEFEVDGMRKPYPVMWSVETKLVRQSKGGKLENKEELMKKLGSGENNNYPNIKVSKKKIDEMQLVCKKDFKEKEKEKAIKEAYAFTPNRWANQYYQEAIDFGGGGGAPADPNAGGAGAPPEIDGGGDPNATAGGVDSMNPDFGADMGGGDPNADPNAATPDAGTNPDASTATTNDISQQIADNVANATAANTAAAGQADPMTQNPTFDANVDDTFAKLDDTTGGDMSGMDTPPPTDDTTGSGDDMNPDFGADMGDTNMSDPTNPASSLDDIETDIPDNSSTDAPDNGGQEMGGADIENMSMDDMIQQGIEKIKSMPMGQLREFLSDGSGAIGTSSTSNNDELSALESAVMNTNTDLEVIMESVIDPKKQVNICVRRVLGDLNNNKKGLSDIFKDTKKDAKHLNKAIHRAIKDVDIDKIAKKELENLSHSLNDMVLRLNDNPSRDEVEEIKSSIKNFTGATKRVSKVMDLSSPVQEA